jgi:hypothetical protein
MVVEWVDIRQKLTVIVVVLATSMDVDALWLMVRPAFLTHPPVYL